MNRFAFLLASLLVLPLAGCPTADDDDSGDTGPVGEAPILTNVVVCEVPNSRAQCDAAGNTGGITLAWDITVTDADGDLLNPQYFILLNNQVPWIDGFFEGDLGAGGGLRLSLPCGSYALGAELPWEFAIRDAEGNESESFTGTYTVLVDAPSFGEPGACAAM